MRLILTADIHCGIPGKIKDCIWSMDIIRQYANDNNIDEVLILGDLFHDRVSLNIEVLNAVYNQLKQSKEDGQHWLTFPGNHDMYMKNSWEVNSLRVLGEVITVYDKVGAISIGKIKFLVIPFVYYESKYMETLAEVEKQADENDILLTHIGVNGAKLNECFLLKNWNIVDFSKSKFKQIYTGHFHCHQQVGHNVWYPGSPIPFRFDEGLVDHGFFVLDLDTKKHTFIKIFDICEKYSDYRPPDYITLVDTDLTKATGNFPKNNIRVILSKEYTHDELMGVKNILQKRGAINVSWSMPQKNIDEAVATSCDIEKVNSPEDLFNSWLEVDKPDLDKKLLAQILGQVTKEAEERLVTEEVEE